MRLYYSIPLQIDMTSDKESRWSHSLSQELPKRKGTINSISKFDAGFFGIHSKQVRNVSAACIASEFIPILFVFL